MAGAAQMAGRTGATRYTRRGVAVLAGLVATLPSWAARAALAGDTGPAAPPELACALALTGAWNAGDVESVVGLFVDDAQIRQRGARISESGPHVLVEDVFGGPMQYIGEPPAEDGDAVVWAGGAVAIRAWVTRFLSAGHQIVSGHFQVAGNVVTWDYRVPLPESLAVQLLQLKAREGTAEVVVVAGQIRTLTIASAPPSPVPRFQPVATARNSQDRAGPSVGPGVAAAVIALAGTVALAASPRSSR